jgi:hypothetical protein
VKTTARARRRRRDRVVEYTYAGAVAAFAVVFWLVTRHI